MTRCYSHNTIEDLEVDVPGGRAYAAEVLCIISGHLGEEQTWIHPGSPPEVEIIDIDVHLVTLEDGTETTEVAVLGIVKRHILDVLKWHELPEIVDWAIEEFGNYEREEYENYQESVFERRRDERWDD